MKFLYIFLLIGITSCATSKNKSKAVDTILYHGYSSELNGDLDVILKNSSSVNCNANIIQVNCDEIDAKQLILKAMNGEVTLKLLDDKSYYFTPNCNDKKVKLSVFKKTDSEDKLIQVIDIRVSK